MKARRPALPDWVTVLPVGQLATNCYAVHQEGLALIDPGGDPIAVEAAARLEQVLLTHAHGDHWAALPALLRAYPDCLVAASDSAMGWLGQAELNLSGWMGPPATLLPKHPLALTDGDRILAGGVEFGVIATPGHTPGCLSFFADGDPPVLFSGDALFRSSVGRTDLPGGSWPALAQSLRRLAQLPSTTIVLPGHGEPTTIGREVAGNEYLRRAIRS